MSDCAGCSMITRPYGLVVDHLKDEPIPDEVRRFIKVGEEAEARGAPDTLERCPLCAAHFLCEYRIDNDIFQPTTESRWTPFTPERARAWLDSQDVIRERARAELVAFARKAERHWAKALPTLSPDEHAVFAFLASAGSDGATAEAAERRACLPSTDADRVIAALLARGIVRYACPESYRSSRVLARYAITVASSSLP